MTSQLNAISRIKRHKNIYISKILEITNLKLTINPTET